MTPPRPSTACPDWAARLRRGESIVPPPIFPERAAEALSVFRALRIVDAPGSPTFGEACAPWVFDVVASVFGAYDAEAGRRLITEWFICLPKKNSKSTIAAGIMLTAQILNWRNSAELSIIAPTVEVANNSFYPARDMVQRDEELDALLHIQHHTKTVTHRTTNATLKVLAADSETVSGKKSSCTLVDELWLFGKRADAENMLREATGGLASRPEGFVIYLTTQSDDPPAGVFAAKLEYARAVRDGKIVDPQFVPIIFEFPPEMIAADEHLDPGNFRLVNPNLGYSVDEAYLLREFNKARAAGGASLRGFLAKHANVQVGVSSGFGAWVGSEFWPGVEVESLPLDEVLDRSEVVTVGADGGGLDDMFGLAVVGRESGGGKWLAWTHAWLHPVALKRNKANASVYEGFAADGDLTLCERVGQDIEEIVDVVGRAQNAGLLDRLGVDPHGIGSLLDAVREIPGVTEEQLVGISQGWKLVSAIKATERALASGKLRHARSRMMLWCLGNARTELKGNATIITKSASGSGKIDPLMALFNALALMSTNPKPRRRKYQMMFLGGGTPAAPNSQGVPA